MRFEQLHLSPALLRAVAEEGYTDATPIQAQAIPHVLEGRDLVGCAQTGTGKTAAFALPILQRLAGQPMQKPRQIRVLVLAPTRELATQIHESFQAYGRHVDVRSMVMFGGVGQEPQVRNLQRGPDVLVATPGRLLDLMNQRFVHLAALQTLVLDEADRMLDMGFVRDVQRIVAALPKVRQTLLWSATMAPEVAKLAAEMLHNPVRVAVTPQATTVERIRQSVHFVQGKTDKRDLLDVVLRDPSYTRTIVFTRTKHGANKVVENLHRVGVVAEAIHGNKSQGARTRALDNFKSGATRVLVATDIAARGIDVDGVSHVINYDLPNIPESYVHRIGRTARAGAEGIALSFCDPEERAFLSDIEKLIRQRIPVVSGMLPERPAGYVAAEPEEARRPAQHRPSNRGHQRPGQPPPRQPQQAGPRQPGQGQQQAGQGQRPQGQPGPRQPGQGQRQGHGTPPRHAPRPNAFV